MSITTVVNLRRESYDVYIGRPGKKQPGLLGNPIVRNQYCPVCAEVHRGRGATLDCFERYFAERIASDPAYKALVLQARGKKLGCFCAPRRCHGDVIAAYLNSLEPTP